MYSLQYLFTLDSLPMFRGSQSLPSTWSMERTGRYAHLQPGAEHLPPSFSIRLTHRRR